LASGIDLQHLPKGRRHPGRRLGRELVAELMGFQPESGAKVKVRALSRKSPRFSREADMSSAAGVETANPKVPLPSTSGEQVTMLAHYHRAEMGRMASWRDRIDRTSNWAITVVAAMLSITLSTPNAHHGVLLFAMLLVILLLRIEARRYRFFDVYRSRVRQMERYYFAQIFSPMKDFSANWQQILGETLREPRFRISYADAFSRRLRRNYFSMFFILLLAWVLKISTPALQGEGTRMDLVASFREVVSNAALGPLSGWVILAAVALFYLGLAYASWRRLDSEDQPGEGEVHV
jgi:uncharacterized membrane protein